MFVSKTQTEKQFDVFCVAGIIKRVLCVIYGHALVPVLMGLWLARDRDYRNSE